MTTRTVSTFSLSRSSAVPVVMKIAPIYTEEPTFQPITATLYPSSSTPRTVSTYALPFCSAAPIVATRAPIEI